jgi:hypothetical protein
MYTMKESVAVAKEADAKKGVSPTKSDNSILRLRDEPERQLGSLRGVIGNIRRDGGTPSVESIATELGNMHTAQRAPALLALQQTHGNRYVQRIVAGIQAKLKVGQPGDIYEQEADRVADSVTRMPEPEVKRQIEDEEEFLQPKLEASSEYFSQRQIEGADEEEVLQTKNRENTPSEVTNDLESRIHAIQGGGQPMAEPERSFFEPRFGYDFNEVKVHTDIQAAESAQVMNARAFTVGQDIVFNKGEYAPETVRGGRLLAHELTHVLQQIDGGPGTRIIQRLVTRDVTTEQINNRFLMFLTDEELQTQINLLELELYSEPEEQSIEPTELAQIRSENLQRLHEELYLRETVSSAPSATGRQRSGLEVIRRLRNEIRGACQQFQVPPELIAAVIMHESQARSGGDLTESVQALLQGGTASIGIGQMQVRTAREIQRQFPSLPTGEPRGHLLNERHAVQFVTAYLSSLMTDIEDFLSGEGVVPNTDQLINLTAIAYNMGWENLRERNLRDRRFGNTMAERVEHILRVNRYITLTTHYIPWIRQQVQFKLINGSPDDKYEHEADRVAEQVMRMPEPQVQRQPEEKEEELIQTKPLAEEITPLVQRQVEGEEEEELQAKEIPGKTPEVTSDLESRINALGGGGQPLPESVRAFFEPRFGYDFSQVRVHTDGEADSLNQQINAKAFTTRKNVFFRGGNYNPYSSDGRELMAHELTHVVQQTEKPHRMISLGQQGTVAEQKADDAVGNRSVQRIVAGGERDTSTQTLVGEHLGQPPAIQREGEEGRYVRYEILGRSRAPIERFRAELNAGIPEDQQTGIALRMVQVLPAVAAILDEFVSAQHSRAEILDRTAHINPGAYGGLGLSENDANALWDFYKARWESPDRGARQRWLGAGQRRIGQLILPWAARRYVSQHYRSRILGRINGLIRQRIRALRADRNFAVLSQGGVPLEEPIIVSAPVRPRPTRRRSRRQVLTPEQITNPAYQIPEGGPESPITLGEVRSSRAEIRITPRPAESLLWVRTEIVSLVGTSRYTLMRPLISGSGSGLLFDRHAANCTLFELQREADALLQALSRTSEGEVEGTTDPSGGGGPSVEAQRAHLRQLNDDLIPQATTRLAQIDRQVQAAADTVAQRVLQNYTRERQRLLARWAQRYRSETLTPLDPSTIGITDDERLRRILIGFSPQYIRNHMTREARVLLFRLDQAIVSLQQASTETGEGEGETEAATRGAHPLLREVERTAAEASLAYSPGPRIELDPVGATGLLDRPEGVYESGGGGYRAGVIEGEIASISTASPERSATHVLPAEYRPVALDILRALERLEGAPTSLNTWDSADITAGSGLAARNRLQEALVAFQRTDPEGFRQLFGRYGINAYEAGDAGQLSVMVPESGHAGAHTVQAGDIIYGEHAIQYIIRDPVLLAQFRRAGHSESYQRALVRETLNSITAALRTQYRDRTWQEILQGLPEEVAGQAINAVSTVIHGSGSAALDRREGLHRHIDANCADADLDTVEGRRTVAEAAAAWLDQNLGHRASGYLEARATRLAAAAATTEATENNE